MTHTPTTPRDGREPGTLSSLLRGLDADPGSGSGDIDLEAALIGGTRRRRRRRAGTAAVSLVVVTAMLGLGQTLVEPGAAHRGPASSTPPAMVITGSRWQPDTATLLAEGFVELPAHHLLTPGSPDDQQPLVYVGPDGTSIALIVSSGGCGDGATIEVGSQTDSRLTLIYREPQRSDAPDCGTSRYELTFEVPLASRLDPEAVVVLDLPGGRVDSPQDVVGQEVTGESADVVALGETEVPADRVLLPEGRSTAFGDRYDTVYLDAEGTRVRLRFGTSPCADLAVRPPQEVHGQVRLDVVTTVWSVSCFQSMDYEDLLVTLDLPLGSRQIVVTEETRDVPSAP